MFLQNLLFAALSHINSQLKVEIQIKESRFMSAVTREGSKSMLDENDKWSNISFIRALKEFATLLLIFNKVTHAKASFQRPI